MLIVSIIFYAVIECIFCAHKPIIGISVCDIQQPCCNIPLRFQLALHLFTIFHGRKKYFSFSFFQSIIYYQNNSAAHTVGVPIKAIYHHFLTFA